MARSPQFTATVALVAAVSIWASSFAVMKAAVAHYHPLLVMFGRMGVAALLFGVAAPSLLRHARAAYVPGDVKRMLFMALCEPCLYFIFESYALTYTSASQAGMATAMLPAMVALTAQITLGERLPRRTWVGFGAAMAGVVWLSLAGVATEDSPNPALGNFLEFVAMVCAVGYMVMLKYLSARYSPWFLTAVQAGVGAVFYAPALLFPAAQATMHIHPGALWAVLYLGSFVSIGAYGLYNFGTSRLPAGQASAFINLIPAISALMGFIFLGERFTPSQCMAAGVVFVGVYLSQSRGRCRHKGTEKG